MKMIYLISVFALLWLSVGSCIERIDVPNARQAGIINIYGLLTPTEDVHQVNVGFTSEKNRITEAIEDAKVTLIDDQGNEADYQYWEKGKYRLYPEQMDRVPGRTYYIQVTLSNGQLYRSTPETMPVAVGSDSAYWVITPNRDIDVYTESQLPETDEPLYLRWVVEQCYMIEPTDFPDPFNSIPPPCYAWSYPSRQRLVLFNGAENPTNFIAARKVVHTPIDFRFKIRHFFLVEQLSITKEAHDYWKQVNIIVNNTGSIFDTPPASIAGNIYNVNDSEEQVLGFFEVAKTDTNIFDLTKADINFDIARYCEYYPTVPWYQLYPAECLDCLILPNSSYFAPWFWR